MMEHFTDPGRGGRLPEVTRLQIVTNYSGQRVECICPKCGNPTFGNNYDGKGLCKEHGLVQLPQWNPQEAA